MFPTMKSPTLLRPIYLTLTLLSLNLVSARADLLTGLVSYLPLDVNNSGVTPDMSFANALTVNGAPSVTSGQFSNAFNLSSTTSDYLVITHGPLNVDTGLPIYAAGSYTICMWVKGLGSQGTARYIFTEASTTSNNPLLLMQTGNTTATRTNLDILIRNDNSTAFLNHVVSVGKVFDGVWHHVAWVDDKGACKLYIDGNLDSSFNYVATGTLTFNTTTIGALVRAAVSGLFTGSIDDAAVWERALSQAEIQQVRTSGIPTPIPARAPTFVSQPASVTKHVGDWALFSAGVIGNRPFTYQWFKNGSPITDATNQTFRVSNLNTNNTGDFYSANVTNPGGFISSTNAVITVLADPTPAVSNGIISYWPLDEATNSPAVSPDLYSGNFMALSNADSSALVIGEYGNALSFDGLSQYTSRIGGFPVYNNLNYSVSIWVKADGNTQNDRRVFSEGNSTNNTPLFTIGTDPSGASQLASVFIRNDANAAIVNSRKSTRIAFDNNWHHLVWTDANGQGKLYIDGALDETDFTYTRSSLSANLTSLGAVLRATAGNFYFGDIDEVAAWNRVLSWTEIQQVMTNGVPLPPVVVPPAISIQPSDQTNAVFAGDTVNFTVQATGSAPLSYQWRKNGANISGALNPTALTNVLTLTNVQPADSAGYFVVVTNSAGSITSSVAQLLVTPYTPATNGEVLKVDFGLAGQPVVQPGFSEMTLATNPTNFNGVSLAVSPIGGGLDARNRTPFLVDNPPFLTQSAIYNDFVFQTSATDGTGVRLAVGRLAPNTRYGVTIWSWDSQSNNGRISDWTETASGTPIIIQTGYDILGTVTNDYEFTLGGLLTSSATGTLQIEGRHDGGAGGPAVIVNALRLVANPVPNSRLFRTKIVDTNIVIAAVGEYPGQAIAFEQNSNLVGGAWVPAVNSVFGTTNGMVIMQAFPITETQLFYRTVTATP